MRRSTFAACENRRFLWTAAIAFALAAVVFPLIVLAAFGHFSSVWGETPSPNQAQTGDPGHATDGAYSPTSLPSISPISDGTYLPTGTAETLPPYDYGLSPTNRPGVVHGELSPTTAPSASPSVAPSASPSTSSIPSTSSSSVPSSLPSQGLSNRPTLNPSLVPTRQPTSQPTSSPTMLPPTEPVVITYNPGQLTVIQNGLLLSTGLSAKIIAKTGNFVEYRNGNTSSVRFLERPDFGATFPDPNPFNPGGWIYTINSEAKNTGSGGVGAFTVDSNGEIIKYEMVLRGTTMNCGGGKTPWNTWISCEEFPKGQVYQVDPSGKRSAEKTVLGGASGGRFESFSYDIRNRDEPHFFVTEDSGLGALRRFTPSNPNWDVDPWTMLHGNGTLDYLVLTPTNINNGTFEWISNLETARSNAQLYYPDSEGIDVYDYELFFVCKKIKQLFVLNLDNGTYTNATTKSGLFDGAPDQVQRILNNYDDVLYFTEEGGRDAGVHGRNALGNFYTILESPQYIDETSGLAWDPSGRHLYVAYQENGLLFDITRTDGLPFYGTSLNVKWHAQVQG